nr:pirin family protein [Shewanella nanhaiensis]
MNPDIWAEAAQNNEISHGLGDFIYLASGYFKPNEGVPIHPHNDVDIVSVILSGSVGHKGSLGDGTVIEGPGVQVQRAGTGMRHSEFSLSQRKAEIIQVWFRPPEQKLTPKYQNFELKRGKLTTVLGGENDESFNSNMLCRVGFVSPSQTIECDTSFVAMIIKGTAEANGIALKEGDLFEGEELMLSSNEGFGLILITGSE